MKSRRYAPTVLLAALALFASGSLAGKGGKGKPGGGDPPADADPAIVYVQNDDLYVMDADGGNKTKVLDASLIAPGSLAYPTWNGAGSRIVFTGRDQYSIQTVNVDGTGRDVVYTSETGSPLLPAWSPAATPDGEERIAFNLVVRNEDGTSSNEVWLVRPDGAGVQNLTSTPNRSESHPAWSPDGSKLAVFYQDLETQEDGSRIVTGRGLVVLHLAAGNGGHLVVASEEYIVQGSPTSAVMRELSWARTQDRVVYRANVDGQPEIFTLDLTSGATPKQLTFTPDLDEYSPSWSPDDSRIVYMRKGAGKWSKLTGIYVLNAHDGTGVTSLDAKDGHVPDARR
jgi:Tol biopolymer transport system component